jgi:hypothetical protein
MPSVRRKADTSHEIVHETGHERKDKEAQKGDVMMNIKRVFDTKIPKSGWKKVDWGFSRSGLDLSLSIRKAQTEMKKGRQVLFVEPKKQTMGFEKFYLYSRKLGRVV